MKTRNHYCREQFGKKLYKLTLNGGMTCPNRDGTLGRRGCIFCFPGCWAGKGGRAFGWFP